MVCLWNTDNMQLYFYPWELMFHFYQHLKTRLDEYRDRCIWVLQLLTQKSIQHSSNASLMQCGVVTLLKLLRCLILQWWVIFVMIFFEGKWRMQHSKTKPALLTYCCRRKPVWKNNMMFTVEPHSIFIKEKLRIIQEQETLLPSKTI